MINTFFISNSMNFEVLRIIIAILGTSIAAYFDIFNKKNIPELLLYVFLCLSVIIALTDLNPLFLLYSFGGALIIGIMTFLLYKQGQLGGADIFILCSLALLLPIQPSLFSGTPLVPLPFIFSIILISGIFFIIYVLIKYTPIILKRKEKIEKKRIIYSFLLFALLLVFIGIYIQTVRISIHYLLLMVFLIFTSCYFILFKERLQKSLIEKIPLKKIEPEDVIALEYIDKKLIAEYNIPKVVSKKDLERLKKAKIKLYPVYTQLPPFIPFILIGLFASLYFGDILYLLTTTII